MSKIVGIVAVAVVLVLVVASAFGYFFYLAPRLEIKSFTENIAPLSDRDMQIAIEMSALADRVEIDEDEEFDKDKFLKDLKQLKDGLEKAQAEYEDILSQVNSLESSERTDGLKQDFVSLNQFYLDEIPYFQEMIVYFEKLIEPIDKVDQASKVLENSSPTDLAQITAEFNAMNSALRSATADLQKLTPPPGFADLHNSLVSALTDMSGILDEAVQAINTLDIEGLNAIEAKITAWESKYYDELDFENNAKEFDRLMDEVDAEEDEANLNAKQGVDDIRAQYGDRWVFEGLQYDYVTGWASDSLDEDKPKPAGAPVESTV